MKSVIGIDRMRLINVSINSIDLNTYKGHIVSGEGIKIYEVNLGQDIEIADIDITIKGNSSNEKDRVIDETFLPFIYELDDKDEWDKEECWIKANPGLGTIKNIHDLRDYVNKAKNDP